jgi:5-methylcytosine-specific restriction endonuclease McrA
MRLADERRGSRHARGYDSRWSAYSKQFIQEHPLCADPYRVHGELGAFTEVTDHVVPPWAGGDFLDPANHQPLCTTCNLRKAADDRRLYHPRGGCQTGTPRPEVPACGNDAQNGEIGAQGGVER